MSKNSTEVKNKASFLKPDINHHHDYELVKSGKGVFNIPKHQLYNNHHSTIHDFTLNPKNTFNEYPFNGSSFYLDFDLPNIEYQYHQFVLRGLFTNKSQTADIQILPYPLCIDRLVLLKNSNVLSEVSCEDIFLYNMNKIATKYGTYNDDFNYNMTTGLMFDPLNAYKFFMFDPIPKTKMSNFNFELPLCLTNSNFPSNLIKNQLTVRIYFKGTIATSTIVNTDLGLRDVKLMLRMKETSHNIYKEPKFNHIFTKKIITKINVPKLDKENNYILNIPSFSSVVSFALIFFRDQDNDVFKDNGWFKWYQYKKRLEDVSIVDSTGKNILKSDLIMNRDYNRYLINENFKEFGFTLNKLTEYWNDGQVILLPFCYDGNMSYNGNFNGGYSFDSSNDYKIKFKYYDDSTDKSSVLNIMWFSPTLLNLENGDLTEILS